MIKKIGIISLGCPKNLVDSEIMLGLLKRNNYEITADESIAEIIIVNTCGFIEAAKQESINTILQMVDNKKDKCEILIVTGCLAERYKDEIIKEIPQVDAVLGTGSYGEIVKVLDEIYSDKKHKYFAGVQNIEYLSNERLLTTKNGSAYLKIAEGCDNCCSYCVIPSLRGKYMSRSLEDIYQEAISLANQGVKELVLVAQDTTSYGKDLYNENKLVDLIKMLSNINNINWIRLLYCYPEEIDDRLIEEIKTNNKVCKYLDIPIQHISDRILKLMGRRGKGEEIKALIQKLRKSIPGIVLRTSLIVGFPTEDEQDFKELVDFVISAEFEWLGVFTYSKEEGTPAEKLKPQILKKIKQKRLETIMQLQKEIVIKKNNSRLGKVYQVINEGVSEDGIFFYGRSYSEAPEIDGRIYYTSREQLMPGNFENVKILNIDDYDLIGDVLDESAQ